MVRLNVPFNEMYPSINIQCTVHNEYFTGSWEWFACEDFDCIKMSSSAGHIRVISGWNLPIVLLQKWLQTFEVTFCGDVQDWHKQGALKPGSMGALLPGNLLSHKKLEVKLGNNARNFPSPQSVVTFSLSFWALITAASQEILRFFFALPGIQKN